MMNPYEATGTDAIRSERRGLSAMHARWCVFAGSIALLPFAWIAVSIDSGNPTWWKPFPLFPVLTVFLLKSKLIAFLLIAAFVLPCFVVSNWSLYDRSAQRPQWSLIVLMLHAFNGYHLWASFSTGERNLGWAPTASICSVSSIFFLAQVLLGVFCVLRPRFYSAFAFQWLAWLWFLLFAFPLLGPLFTLI